VVFSKSFKSHKRAHFFISFIVLFGSKHSHLGFRHTPSHLTAGGIFISSVLTVATDVRAHRTLFVFTALDLTFSTCDHCQTITQAITQSINQHLSIPQPITQSINQLPYYILQRINCDFTGIFQSLSLTHTLSCIVSYSMIFDHDGTMSSLPLVIPRSYYDHWTEFTGIFHSLFSTTTISYSVSCSMIFDHDEPMSSLSFVIPWSYHDHLTAISLRQLFTGHHPRVPFSRCWSYGRRRRRRRCGWLELSVLFLSIQFFIRFSLSLSISVFLAC
jgi:hypothetical protein